MGHDENTNYLAGGANQGTPATPANSDAPSAPFAPGAPISPATPTQAAPVASTTPGFGMQTLSNNRLGMRPARDLKNVDELNRIVAAETRENIEANGGDIILAPSAPVKNKKKVFVLLLVAAAVILLVSVIVWTTVSKVGYSAFEDPNTPAGAFVEWLLNGDGNISLNTDGYGENVKLSDFDKRSDKLIYPLNFYNVSRYNSVKDSDIEEYFTELNKRYEALRNDGSNIAKKESIKTLGSLLQLLEGNVNYMKIKSEILAEYGDSDYCANCYKRFSMDFGDEALNSMLKTQKMFYVNAIQEDRLYLASGCYDENTSGDYACILVNNPSMVDYINSASEDVDTAFGKMFSMRVDINQRIIMVVKEIRGVQ